MVIPIILNGKLILESLLGSFLYSIILSGIIKFVGALHVVKIFFYQIIILEMLLFESLFMLMCTTVGCLSHLTTFNIVIQEKRLLVSIQLKFNMAIARAIILNGKFILVSLFGSFLCRVILTGIIKYKGSTACHKNKFSPNYIKPTILLTV